MTNLPADEMVKRATVAFNDYLPVTDKVSIQPGRCWDHAQMRAALEAALSHQGEVVESENERIGAFVRRVEREGASNLHQSMAHAFITHALSGEHDEAG